LNLVNANFIPFQQSYFILIVAGALTVAGNTQFPIFLRLTIWTLSKLSPKESRFRQTLRFLLHHPRRCFIYLFPGKQTGYLFFIQLSIDFTMWVLFLVLNLGLPAVTSIPTNIRVFDGLFQATGLRTSGAYIITMSSLAPALLVAYLVVMYISNFPIVMALRQTNTYEERSIGLDKGESSGGLGMHLRRQLAYDIWFQIFAWFLICIIEREKIVKEEEGFTLFSILFEVTSAYGTVGLSTGVPYDAYSLSGAFQSLSKVVMLAVMLRGRHRGLPLAIDRSILLPGEDLMHKMDKEYNEGGIDATEEEKEYAELRKEEIAKDPESQKSLEAEKCHVDDNINISMA
jgi:potassium uptake Trk family protein